MSPQFYTIIRKILAWVGMLFAVAILQTTVFVRIAPFGVVPDLMLPAVLAIAIFDSERTGAVAGIAAGVMIGALGGTGVNLLPLFYMLCAYLVGIWATIGLSANFPSFLVYMLSSAGARMVITLLAVDRIYASYSLLDVFPQLLFPEFAATMLCAPLLYLPFRRVALLFNRRLKLPD
ncbi:MAG: hypothetical protein IJF49_04045 [Clostridia bacterium]|nr:hypothetical protein [Clostridia bacterium]